MKYSREISPKFIDDLKTGKLKELLEIVKRPNEKLQLEIRKGYINIYYLGGNLLKVTPNSFWFDPKYCLTDSDTKTLEKVKADGSWIKNIPTLKAIMDKWYSKFNKLERQEQHSICKLNRESEKDVYVVDIEYAATGYGRADILAVRYDEKVEKYKVYIIEYKQGNGSVSSGLKIVDGKVVPTSSTGKFSAGIYKHYEDASRLICGVRSDLLSTVRNSIYIRNLLGLAAFPSANSLESIKLDDVIEMRFVLSNYKQQENTRDVLQRELAAVRIKEKESGLKWACLQVPAGDFKLRVEL